MCSLAEAAKTAEAGAEEEHSPVKLEEKKKEEATPPPTPSTPRGKAPEEKIADCLRKAAGEYEGGDGDGDARAMKEEYSSEAHIQRLSQEIMRAMAAKHTAKSKEYNRRLRTLCVNLGDQKNLDFRAGVLAGRLSPSDLCTMETKDMASNELKKKRELIHQESLKARTLDAETAAEFSTMAASQAPNTLEVVGKSNIGKDEVMEITQHDAPKIPEGKFEGSITAQ